jgi:hypothetical protein
MPQHNPDFIKMHEGIGGVPTGVTNGSVGWIPKFQSQIKSLWAQTCQTWNEAVNKVSDTSKAIGKKIEKVEQVVEPVIIAMLIVICGHLGKRNHDIVKSNEVQMGQMKIAYQSQLASANITIDSLKTDYQAKRNELNGYIKYWQYAYEDASGFSSRYFNDVRDRDRLIGQWGQPLLENRYGSFASWIYSGVNPILTRISVLHDKIGNPNGIRFDDFQISLTKDERGRLMWWQDPTGVDLDYQTKSLCILFGGDITKTIEIDP